MKNDLPPPKPPFAAPVLTPDAPGALPELTDDQMAGREAVPMREAPALPSMPVPVPAHSPEHWAAQKKTPGWALDAARARHLQPGADGRASWLENGVLTEAAFDAALDLTLNGSLR